MTRLAAVLLLAGYLALTAVLAVAKGGDDQPRWGTTIAGDPTAEEREILSLQDQLAEMRRLAYQRLKIIRAQRAILRRRLAYDPGHWLEQAFLCIHRYEGRWTDDGAPYWGGLQMDRRFMQTYGGTYWRSLGTANLWPPSVQIAVAISGWLDRGFHPWPNTARRCGLQ